MKRKNTVFVTGVRECFRDDIMELALKGMKLPSFSFVKFGSISGNFKDIETVKDVQRKVLKKIDSVIGKHKKSLILSGDFTVRSDKGIIPVVTSEFLEIFKPDVIVVLEVSSSYVMHKYENPGDILMQQYINRGISNLYAYNSGAVLKFINIERGNIKKALREVSDILKFAMEGS
jgi:adenylate kinase